MRVIKSFIEFIMDILETISFVGSIFIVVYLFILQPNQVKGQSMEPNFQNGDYILTSKITYKFREIKRGDVIILKSPKNPEIEFIKRIIGLPGDKLMIKDGYVYVNGQRWEEPYVNHPTQTWQGGYVKEGEEFIIPEGFVFVMGDNRPHSSDSREFGPIPIQDIIGVVFYRYFPPSKAGPIKNPLPENLQSSLLLYLPIA